jgi:hypothetical protein
MTLWEPPKVNVLVVATTGRFTTDAIAWIEKHNEYVQWCELTDEETMPDETNVLDPPLTVTGRGGRGLGRDGRHGTHDADAGDPAGEDFEGLARILAQRF